MINHFNRNALYKYLQFIGRSGAFSAGLSVTSGLLLGGLELAISATLAVLLKSLGIANEIPAFFSNLPRSPDFFLFLFVILGLLRGLTQFLAQHSASFSCELVGLRLRQLLIFRSLKLNSSAASLADYSLLQNETFTNAGSFCMSLLIFVQLCFQSAILSAALFWQSPGLTLLAFFLLGLVALLVRSIASASHRINSITPTYVRSSNRKIIRSLRNWNLLRALRMAEPEYQSISADLYTRSSLSIRSWYLLNLNTATPSTFGILIISSLIALHQRTSLMGGVEFVGYLYLFLRFVQGLGNLSTQYGNLSACRPYFTRARAFFSDFRQSEISDAFRMLPHVRFFGGNWASIGGQFSVTDRAANLPFPEKRNPPSLKLENIDFSYVEGKQVLSNFSLQVAAGETVAILGASGSGKSTLFYLILGLIKPRSGKVLLDGISPEDYFARNPHSVGYVGADPYLFEGTLRENLLYGNPYGVEDRDIQSALASAQLSSWAASNPGALDYPLSENGEGLSTGQKQRLSLARALLVRPSILVLDEVSANLDTDTEAEIAETLKRLEGSMTILIVSHREALVRHVKNRVNL